VEGGNLVLDLDDFNFTPTSTLTLIDVAPDALFGEFGNVTFLGDTTAEVNYDFANGDIFLNNFMRSGSAGIVGDYNDDGTVDAADYVVWRKNLGTTNTLPNDDTPGSVLAVDYDRWKANFGRSSAGAASLSPVATPEPATIGGALLLAALTISTRPRRRMQG
jgi:hypothetical protein